MKLQQKRYTNPARTQRQQRVGELIRQILAESIQRGVGHNFTLTNSITITEVQISADLRHCYVYVIPLGGIDYTQALQELRQLKPKLRSLLARQLTLKAVPDLHFEIDLSFDKADKIESLLESPRVARDLKSV